MDIRCLSRPLCLGNKKPQFLAATNRLANAQAVLTRHNGATTRTVEFLLKLTHAEG
jgi:hypothetical protein